MSLGSRSGKQRCNGTSQNVSACKTEFYNRVRPGKSQKSKAGADHVPKLLCAWFTTFSIKLRGAPPETSVFHPELVGQTDEFEWRLKDHSEEGPTRGIFTLKMAISLIKA